jgi:hypothetical protein
MLIISGVCYRHEKNTTMSKEGHEIIILLMCMIWEAKVRG